MRVLITPRYPPAGPRRRSCHVTRSAAFSQAPARQIPSARPTARARRSTLDIPSPLPYDTSDLTAPSGGRDPSCPRRQPWGCLSGMPESPGLTVMAATRAASAPLTYGPGRAIASRLWSASAKADPAPTLQRARYLKQRSPVMALPKRKHSKARTRKRRAHQAIRPKGTTLCPRCDTVKEPHCVCPTCGHYAGREVIATEKS